MQVVEVGGVTYKMVVVESLDGYPALLVDDMILVSETGDPSLNLAFAHAAVEKSTPHDR